MEEALSAFLRTRRPRLGFTTTAGRTVTGAVLHPSQKSQAILKPQPYARVVVRVWLSMIPEGPAASGSFRRIERRGMAK